MPLLQRIGGGGMGEVWLAEKVTAGSVRRRAAVKRILPRYAKDPVLRGRFVAEARITALLEHPNVVQLIDFGESPDLYLVLEFVDGMSLLEMCRTAGANGLPVASALFVVAEAANGLDYAHRRAGADGSALGIVHRDISPANLLVSFEGNVKVGDFGIARIADNVIRTEAGLALGKICYMAPEQAFGRPLDHRVDVFALGIVLWEMLARRPLVPRGDMNAALRMLASGGFPPPSSYVPGIPAEVEQFVASLLAVDPSTRPASCAHVARTARALLHRIAPAFDARDMAAIVRAFSPERARRGAVASDTQGIVGMPALATPAGAITTATQPAASATSIAPRTTIDPVPPSAGATVATVFAKPPPPQTANVFAPAAPPMPAASTATSRLKPVHLVAALSGAVLLGGLAVLGVLQLVGRDPAPAPNVPLAPQSTAAASMTPSAPMPTYDPAGAANMTNALPPPLGLSPACLQLRACCIAIASNPSIASAAGSCSAVGQQMRSQWGDSLCGSVMNTFRQALAAQAVDPPECR